MHELAAVVEYRKRAGEKLRKGTEIEKEIGIGIGIGIGIRIRILRKGISEIST